MLQGFSFASLRALGFSGSNRTVEILLQSISVNVHCTIHVIHDEPACEESTNHPPASESVVSDRFYVPIPTEG